MNQTLNSPARRSMANNTIRTPGRYQPNATQISDLTINDDEAERESRRSTMIGAETEMNLTEENAEVSSCLRMFNENKFNRDNVWSVQLIDHFSNLVAKHHKSMLNFQVAGSTLEASAKVYVLRVDSLHQDTLRMVQNLSRQSARTLGAARDDDDDENDNANRSGENNQENDLNSTNTAGKKKEKRKRRAAAVVTKNPDSLNGKLDTNPFTDPFFAKLNSIVGDINSSSRLMQNIIRTKNGSLQLRMDYPFWDKSENEKISYDENENYENREIVRIKTLDAKENHAIHHQLKGYSISDKPAEDEPEEELPQGLLQQSLGNSSFHDRSMNASGGAGIIFDPNAEVEPIANDNNFMIDYGGATEDNDQEFEQLEDEDRAAIMRCRGVRREAVIIEDMAPVDAHSGSLEYSYRPLDRFSEFWAGPSHWKIRRQPSVAKRSFTAANQNATGQVVAAKRKPRKKKEAKNFTANELYSFDPSTTFVTRDPENPIKRITYTKTYISRKWNAKKLKLPTHIKIEQNVFDKFLSGPQFRPMNQKPEKEPEIEVENYDYNNEVDNEYCRDVHTETDADTETDFGTADNLNTSDERIMSPSDFQSPVNQTADFIATDFAGAPEQVEKIQISYAKRAKPVDMKQLKAQCWNLISDLPKAHPHTTTSKGELVHEIEFKDVFDNLPRILTKSMAENISTGLVFYSVLHLANEKGVRVVQHDNLEGCTILKKYT